MSSAFGMATLLTILHHISEMLMALTHSMACRKIGDIEKGSYSANANF